MVPIISIVGKSGSVKTTLIEKLLPEFKRRGYRVGTIKHHLHNFDIDKEGKDSWRHAQAGAKTVVVASPHKVAMVKNMTTDLSLEDLRDRYFYDVDFVIAEGFKGEKQPKVEVFRAGVHEKPLFTNEDKNLLATVTDSDVQTGVPCFGLEEIIALVNFLERTLFEKPSGK
jgi:molybdopterin-guanine dinucleotide biosynthesis protein B